MYDPQQNLAVDESLMKFRGRLSYVQYNPSKRAQFGVKFYKICESTYGYCMQFSIYTGAYPARADGVPCIPPQRQEGYEFFPGVGYYMFHTTTKNVLNASNIYQNEGLHPAIINSEEEAAALLKLAPPNDEAWVGIHDPKNCDFRTKFGTPLNETGFSKRSGVVGGQDINCHIVQELGEEKAIVVDESFMERSPFLEAIHTLQAQPVRYEVLRFVRDTFGNSLYTQEKTMFSEKYKDESITGRIVLDLSDSLLDKGYTIYLDNWYTSPALVEKLTVRCTDVLGTMRSNRKEFPTSVKLAKLKKGETSAAFRGKQMVMKWKDKRDVIMVSTVHRLEMSRVEKRGKVQMKPCVVQD
ncbi:hypothetical protein J437_LFUL018989 [Ladona fulva]|uniref:PiggyBac transposable element-derived protein domain-containing protein n=1 Tax=Ladona fulva TaxID=123851 RepID=A0A8K0P9Z5_LADFU|nr:hypothetical protein J437_LFUL018989 [Ladona fulva]